MGAERSSEREKQTPHALALSPNVFTVKVKMMMKVKVVKGKAVKVMKVMIKAKKVMKLTVVLSQ